MDQSFDIERAFLARIFYRRGGRKMTDLYVTAKTEGITPDCFSDPECRLIWEAAEELFNGNDFDDVTLYDVLEKATYLAKKSRNRDIQKLEVTSHFFDGTEKPINGTETIEAFCRLIRDHFIQRNFKELAERCMIEMSGGDSPQTIISSFITRCQDHLASGISRTKISVADEANTAIAEYENAHHHVVELGEANYTPGIPMPWRKLSYAMNGFEPALCILAARPGVGKTSMAVNMARFWMDNGYKVVFNSLDMSGRELIRRQIAELSRVSSRKMKFGKSDKETFEKDMRAVKDAGKRLASLEEGGIYRPMAEYDVDRLKATCRILKDQGKIDVLIVDYIQQMNYAGSERHGDVQKITRVSQMLHSITIELGIPVLALSQLNRSNDKDEREPRLSDLRGSGAIEQDASYVILLDRAADVRKAWLDPKTAPVQYLANPAKTEILKSFMPVWVTLAKSRDGDAEEKIPFVVVQNKYAWYQADYEADDKFAKFARVWDDWRHDPIEQVWERNGALIRSDARIDIAATNRRIEQSVQPKASETVVSGQVTDVCPEIDDPII